MVREAFPDAVIVRPADVYGPEDRLLRFYARLKFFPFGVIPVLRGGEGVVKRPVHVSQVMYLCLQVVSDVQNCCNEGGVVKRPVRPSPHLELYEVP